MGFHWESTSQDRVNTPTPNNHQINPRFPNIRDRGFDVTQTFNRRVKLIIAARTINNPKLPTINA
jgi:hypothetical protein